MTAHPNEDCPHEAVSFESLSPAPLESPFSGDPFPDGVFPDDGSFPVVTPRPASDEVVSNTHPLSSCEATVSNSHGENGHGEDVEALPCPVSESPAVAELPPDPEEAFESVSGVEAYYYDETGAGFWIRNDAKTWVNVSEGGFKRHLKKSRGLRDKAEAGRPLSALDEEVSRVEKNCRVAYAGILGGYKKGVHMVAGRCVLITEDPILIEPKAGEWPIIRRIWAGLLCGEEPADDAGAVTKIDQRDYFFAWLRHTVECLRRGKTDPGLALGIAGEPNCGKSFLALMLRWLLGGRVGKPYAAMTGQDNFNRDAAEAVLQLVDDENQSDTNLQARQKFTSEIKKFNANNEFRLRSMHKDGFAVEVLRRLVILVNMQGIMVLPPLDGDVDDKIMLLKGYSRPKPAHAITSATPYAEACWPAPLPTRTAEERETYRETVKAELPAFLHWLLIEWKPPAYVTGGRFVVPHWHHPQIVSELQELSPHVRLWELILRAGCVLHEYRWNMEAGVGEYFPRKEWRGSAGELEVLLKKTEGSKLSDGEKKEIPSTNWLGKRLTLCEKHFGASVCSAERTKTGRVWTLRCRAQDEKGHK